jgi:hypothetical protein
MGKLAVGAPPKGSPEDAYGSEGGPLPSLNPPSNYFSGGIRTKIGMCSYFVTFE